MSIRMIRKYALIIVSILILSLTTHKNAFAKNSENASVGLSAYSTFSDNIGGIFNFKFKDVPIMFGLGIAKPLNEDTEIFIEIDATTDWWVLDLELVGPFHFYLGLGAYYNFDIREVDRTAFDFDLGFRFPLGISAFFSVFEIYLEVAPGVHMLQTGTRYEATFFEGDIFRLSAQTGLRFWF